MLYAVLALTILLTCLAIVIAVLLVEVMRKLDWLRLTLIPWINALNTKLGLPK